MSDFAAQEADAVLGCEDRKATAGIEDDNNDRLQLLLNSLRVRVMKRLAGLD